MKLHYDFRFTVNCDSEKLEQLHGPNWPKHFQESASEFAAELNDWINKHPFIQGCTMTTTKEP